MITRSDREFGHLINGLVQKENLTREEAREAFCKVLGDETTEMQQGAFLAALTAKGETAEEVAGAWEAIYELDTEKVSLEDGSPVVENSGTGMDTFKTFNISTAASIIAAAGGVRLARHGARAITSYCGTVDMAEALGVDVECSPALVAASIKKAGIGLFNGMSPKVHPRALGRILSKICFGSTLNIAASLANPALPKRGVRGVYAREIIRPVISVMKAIGYERAVVVYGGIENSGMGMDEASVCGPTYCAELAPEGQITAYTFSAGECGLKVHGSEGLSPSNDLGKEAERFASLIGGREEGVRTDAALLNAALIYYVADRASSIEEGVKMASGVLSDGSAFGALEKWVASQNPDPARGLEKLHSLS